MSLLVGIHIEFESSYYRRVMVGIRQYLNLHSFIHTDLTTNPYKADSFPSKNQPQKFDGIIAMILDRKTGEALQQLNSKIVSVTSATPIPSIPKVSTDDRAVGMAACSHLINQGYRELTFVGGSYEYGKLRLEGARSIAADKGLKVRHVPCQKHEASEVAIDKLPAGVICETDSIARQVIMQLINDGYKIPEEVGVVGGDDDEIECALSAVPISSVKLNEEKVGFEAMRIMHDWINGGYPPGKPVLIPPVEIIPRESSGACRTRDQRVQTWLDYLELNLHQIHSVKEYAGKLGVSRRVLERKFREELDRSVFEEITHYRIRRAKQMMAETSLSLAEIGEACGYGDPRTFSLTFRRVEGEPPSVSRRKLKA